MEMRSKLRTLKLTLFITMAIGIFVHEFYGIKWTLLVIVVAYLQLFLHRCPYCSGLLEIRGKPPTYCPKCGQELL